MSTTRVITNAIVITTAIDGDPAVSYIIETSRDGVRIGTNESSAKWRGVIRFLEKEGGDAPVSRAFYAGVALRATDGTYSWTMPPTASPISSIGTTDSPYSITVNKSQSAIVIAIWEERPSNEDINDFSCLSYYTAKKELMVVADGQNAIRLSLDNVHEDFLYDGGSLVAPSGGASSAIHLYDGGVEKTSDATLEVYSVSGTTADTSGAYIDNRVLYVKSINAASASVMVRALYEGTYYYAEFTANRVTQDKYDIILSPSSIAYNSATYQTQRVMVSAKGIGIGGTPITARISSMPHSGHLRAFWAYVSDNGSVGSMSRLSGDAVYKDVTASECANYAGIYFELRWYDNELTSDTATSGYRVCDFETVEIAKAENGAPGSPGAPGYDGVSYKLEITACSLYVKNTAGALITHRVEGQAWKWVGEERTAVALSPSSNTYVAVRTSSASGWVHVTNEYSSGKFVDTNLNGLSYGDERNPTSLLYELYVSGSLVATVVVPFTIEGDNGGAGSMGKICYITGEYSDEITYTSNDEQTVAVEVDNGGENADVYYLIAASNVDAYGIHHGPTDTDYWKKGLSSYNLIRTRYLFADFGHLASFIMTGDWMLSQYGTLIASNGSRTPIGSGNYNTPFSAVVAAQLNGNDINNGIIVCRVSFYCYTDTVVKVTLTPSSEFADYGAVGNINENTLQDATYDSIKAGTGCRLKASGTTAVSTTVSVLSSTSLQHFLIAYAKDYSVKSNNDTMTVTLSGVSISQVTQVKATSGMSHEAKSKTSVPFGWFDPTDPSGESAAVGYKFVPNFAVDGLTGKTYQNDAYVSGEIHAGSGSIGGFSIGTDDLTNSNYDAGITIRDVYDRKSVQIGADAEDTMTGRKAAMVAKATEYNTSDNDSPYNTALYLEARYATYNYAFHGYGNGVLDGYMQGFKVYSFTATSAENAVQMKLGNGMIQAIRSVTVAFAKVYLPKLGEIKETLGITGTRDFCCELIIINQSIIGTSNTVKIEGDDAAYTRTTTDKDAKPVILRGESSKYLDLKDRFNAHFFITYISQRFIANYISG